MKRENIGQLISALLFGSLLILFGIFIIAIDLRKPAPGQEPPLPQNLPSGLWIVSNGQNLIPAYVPVGMRPENFNYPLDKFLIVRYSDVIQCRIEFESHSSINGIWNGSNPYVNILSPFQTKFIGETHTEQWGRLLLSQGSGVKSFRPWLEFNFPINLAYLHNWISVSAQMNVSYPDFISTGKYKTNSTARYRKFDLFVISKEDLEMLREHDNWKSDFERYYMKRSINGLGILGILFILVGIFAITFSIYIYRLNK